MTTIRCALLLTLICASTSTAQDRTERTLDTPEARRQYVLKAMVSYADGLDDVVTDWTKQGRQAQARTLQTHAWDIRLGWNIPLAVRRLQGVPQHGDLKAVLDRFIATQTAAMKACDTAAQKARATGDLDAVQKLQAERKAIETLNKEQFRFWSPSPGEDDRMRYGKVTERVPVMLAPNEQRVPNELTAAFGPNRFRIEGTGRVDTIRVDGQQKGHFGKLVVIDRYVNSENPVLRGALRVKVPSQVGHTNYQAAFVKARRILASPKFDLKPGVTYDWECRWTGGNMRFELTRDGERIFFRDTESSGSVRVGFATTVRFPGDKSALIVAFR